MRPLSRTGNYISNRIGRAIADYDLIEDKDRILVAVSGGKDSMTLLKLLAERRKWAPVKYELIAMHVETDFRCAGCVHTKSLRESHFPPQVCRCPNSDTSKRRMVKNIIKEVEKGCSFVRTNILRSVSRVKEDYINIK